MFKKFKKLWIIISRLTRAPASRVNLDKPHEKVERTQSGEAISGAFQSDKTISYSRAPIRYPSTDFDDADPVISDSDASVLVGKTSWYHKFELRPGIITQGVSEIYPCSALDSLGIPRDLSGMKALDIGAWDGPLTFELERRGAQAFALDIQDPTRVGFATARRVLNSKAVHYLGSVYQLPFSELYQLDVVLFRGVFYHLKYPILAFECISSAMRMGGTLHFEGEGFIHYAETIDGKQVFDPSIGVLARSEIPVCLSYPNAYKKASNWFIPNAACLKGWMSVAGLEVRELHEYTENGAQRIYGTAVKVLDTCFQIEHPLY